MTEVTREVRELQVKKGRGAKRGTRVKKGQKDLKASKVTQGNRVYMDVTANKVTEVSKVSKVKQEYQARMG